MPTNPIEPRSGPELSDQAAGKPVETGNGGGEKSVEVPQPPEYGEVLDQLGPDEQEVSGTKG